VVLAFEVWHYRAWKTAEIRLNAATLPAISVPLEICLK
jgi:hypothetical protein